MINPLIRFIGQLGYVFIAIQRAIGVINGSLTVGSIQAIFQYINQISGPVVQFSYTLNSLQGAIAAAEHVYEIQDGSLTIDGVDIRNISRQELRSLLGLVLQDTWLFNGTVSENIAFGRPSATQEEIISAAKVARIDHFIRTLSEGDNTVLDDERVVMSVGQKQLLTISRAILADPTILILDEATSSVDTRTEIEIQKAMNKLMEGRTSFVIRHRLSTIRNAD